MTFTKKHLAGPLLFLALGLALVGCSGEEQTPKAQTSTSASDQAVKYTQCMREHGITDFPDPVNGEIQLTVRKGTDLDPTSSRFKSAQQACKSLEPPGLFTSAPGSDAQAAGVKFAACMRKNGVPDFPDPKGGRMVMSGNVDPNSPAFQSAVQACRDLAPSGMLGGGQ
ncbi:hypothetical protein [Flindersiella endophytica]